MQTKPDKCLSTRQAPNDTIRLNKLQYTFVYSASGGQSTDDSGVSAGTIHATVSCEPANRLESDEQSGIALPESSSLKQAECPTRMISPWMIRLRIISQFGISDEIPKPPNQSPNHAEFNVSSS